MSRPQAKPGLVLLPGMMCDRRLFAPQIDRFRKSHAIFVPDIGRHNTIELIARSVLNEIPREPVTVCGLSMGGIVAMEMIRQQPGQIDRLVLMDTNHLPDAEDRRKMRMRQIADVEAGKLRQVIVEEMKPNYLAKANQKNQGLLDLLVAMATDLGSRVFVNQSNALMNRKDATPALERWEKPSLIICGSEDELCPLQRHRDIASILPNAQLEIVAGAGHITTLEAPDRINALIGGFVKKWS